MTRVADGTVRTRMLSRTIDLATLRRGVRVATVAYLGLPLLIFAVGWLRAPVAAVVVVALAVVGLALGRGPGPADDAERASVPLGALAASLASVALLVVLSGAGGFGPRTWDWAKHDAVLRDLVAQPWPVRYATGGDPAALVYYVAYYLPAAAVGKAAGWEAANAAIAFTSLAGAVLAVLWLVVLARGSPLVCTAVFAMFAGMDVVGAALVGWPARSLAAIFAEYHLANWAGLWQYTGNASLLFFVPNQAVAGWLVTAIVADHARPGRAPLPVAAVAALALLWSPFVAVGALPLLLAALLAAERPRCRAVRTQLTAVNAAGLVAAAPVVAYFAARLRPLALPAPYHPAQPPGTRGGFWFVPAHAPIAGFLARYAVFTLCEFAVLWVLLLRAARDDPHEAPRRALLWAAGTTLLVLPVFHYGLYNDLVMRASVPALFVLQIGAARALTRRPRAPAALAIAAVLAVGALYPANLLRIHARTVVWSRRLVRVPPLGSVRDLAEIQLRDPAAMNVEFLAQYLGATDTVFFERLARASTPRRLAVPGPG